MAAENCTFVAVENCTLFLYGYRFRHRKAVSWWMSGRRNDKRHGAVDLESSGGAMIVLATARLVWWNC